MKHICSGKASQHVVVALAACGAGLLLAHAGTARRPTTRAENHLHGRVDSDGASSLTTTASSRIPSTWLRGNVKWTNNDVIAATT